MKYKEFLEKKAQSDIYEGFDSIFMPDYLFDFQKYLVEWSLKKGKAAIFADCGMGKTPIQLVWAENIVRKTNKRVLILTPLAVSYQTVEEGEKFGIECFRSTDGKTKGKITVTNYEKLHLFNSDDYTGIVCDESSILKHFGGATQKTVTRFMSKKPFRLLATATPSPNDFYELGTSCEALGVLSYSEMLSRFFNQTDGKDYRTNQIKLLREERKATNYYKKLAYRTAQQMRQWKMKPHAEKAFWKWVCSWARSCRLPSDLGFSDSKFILPELHKNDHIVMPKEPPPGYLFTPELFGLNQEREERKRTMDERINLVVDLANTNDFVFIACHLNIEGDLIEKSIPGSVQVAGKDSDDKKEERLLGFAKGKFKVLITKPKIGAWGLNYQHCNHIITFATHSFEQYYQFVRRCWRFGQKRPVIVDLISTEGETAVRNNMERKAKASREMFDKIVKYMDQSTWIEKTKYEMKVEIPSWL